jgi:hypothetical protein
LDTYTHVYTREGNNITKIEMRERERERKRERERERDRSVEQAANWHGMEELAPKPSSRVCLTTCFMLDLRE